MSRHLDELTERFGKLASCRREIEAAFELLAESFRMGGKLLICGNGGSAADAEHWSSELLKGFCLPRPLTAEQAANLPGELSASLQRALPALPLTSFISAGTAFSNDVRPEYALAQLTFALGGEGDALAGLSTSGNAANVCFAMDVANAMGLSTIALTGRDGGRLAGKAKVAIRAPETETHRVQELHLPIYHCLCLMLEEEFFGK